MTNVLITGAAGFIGSQLAYALWKQKENVIMIDDFSYGKEDNLIFEDHDFRDEIIRCDICDRESMERLFSENKIDYVYHIGAITPLPDCQTNPGKATEVNVAATVNILELSRKYGVKKVIFSSTSAVYENCTSFPTREDDSITTSLVYSTSKYASELFCRAFNEAYGLNVTVLRFANVYGPHIDCLRTQPPVAGYIIRELYYGRPVVLHSNGEQRRDYVYVDDLIRLALLVRESEGFDIVNVSTGTTMSVNEMYDIIAELMGKSQKPEYMPSSHYWYRYPQLYEGAYKISEDVLDNEVNKHTECSNEYAFKKYGWKPEVDVREGLKRTIDFSIEVFKKVDKSK